jgi:hypothetical protein
MAGPRDIRTPRTSDGVERLKATDGYVLGENQQVEDVLAADAELLRSEGIDPAWPGFGNTQRQDLTPAD